MDNTSTQSHTSRSQARPQLPTSLSYNPDFVFPALQQPDPTQVISPHGYNAPAPLRNRYITPATTLTIIGAVIPVLAIVALAFILAAMGYYWAKTHYGIQQIAARNIMLVSGIFSLLQGFILWLWFF